MRDWFRKIANGRSGKKSRTKRSSRAGRALGFSHLSFDPLEDRRLLSASPISAQQAAQTSPLLNTAEVVGRYVFYNDSYFDGFNPAANASDDAAIATDKQALLPGQKATFANYTSSSNGINGVMVDIAGLTGTPTASDFMFHVGNDNNLAGWATAPAPASVTVRPGAGVDGSTRITITWANDVIRDQWLQVDVRATPTTGLAQPDVFYFGNEIGSTRAGTKWAAVDAIDQLATRGSAYGISNLAPITVTTDFNRDGLVNTTDELIAHASSAAGQPLRMIAPPVGAAWPDVVGEYIFYNDSAFDGNDPAAGPSDDGAIAIDKKPLAEGGAATTDNFTNYSRGINGIMVDVAGLNATPSAADFTFRAGNSNDPSTWTAAPAPSIISVRYGAGVGGSARVTLIWPDNAIQNEWLQVTVNATPTTHLTAPAVFYFGNEIGSIASTSATAAVVGGGDRDAVASAVNPGPVPITSQFDVNRDQSIDALDQQIVATSSTTSPALQLIDLPDAAPSPPPAPASRSPLYLDFVAAQVVGRYVFYNNSSFDGNNPVANAADDAAIAPDKRALLPGQTASLANLTDYSRGINGVMIDVAGLPGPISADDFSFLVGSGGGIGSLSPAPAPLSINVRPGAGVNGSSRITITWADGAIANQWLQVTLKATQHTGLAASDTFYFGNLVGATGATAGRKTVAVSATDQFAVQSAESLATGLALASPYDVNRDGLVDTSDEWLTANSTPSPLSLITAPVAPAPAPMPEGEQPQLYNVGDANYPLIFAPNLVTTPDGTVLSIAEGRAASQDSSSNTVLMRRSTDGGATWSPISIIYSVPPFSATVGNPATVVDANTGTVFVLFTVNVSQVFVTSSSDDGLTWSQPVDITDSVKVTADGNPNPAAFPSTPWGWYSVGPGHGIQLTSGPNAGRLMIACDHRLTADNSGPTWSHVIYSDDDGATWHLGGGLDQSVPNNGVANESSVVQLPDGSLYMSIRDNASAARAYSRSYDGGATWTNLATTPDITTPSVEGSLLRVDANTVIFAAPDSTSNSRQQMTVWYSTDNAQTWSVGKTIFYDFASYSDMTLVGNDTVLLSFALGRTNGNSATSIALVRFNLNWLESSTPDQFTWYFNEQAPGASANLQGTSIEDASPWDNRAQAQAASGSPAPVYVAGANGDSALSLSPGNDVQLTPAKTNALQFGASDSFTIELKLRTTSTTGVILGSSASGPNWSLRLLNGFVKFFVSDTQHAVSVISTSAINDGAWHDIVMVRDATNHVVRMYVDGVQIGTGKKDATGNLASTNAVMLNGYSDGTQQIAFDIDTLRVTRAALDPSQFLPANFTAPPRMEPSFGPGAPNTISNLQFWLPGFGPTNYFAGMGYADTLPANPATGSAVQSAIDASSNQYHVSMLAGTRQQLYQYDSQVGASWLNSIADSGSNNPWIVQNSNGTNANNFDFVQNTGVFTISTFVKVGTFGPGRMTLFDTADNTAANPGFNLSLLPDGTVQFAMYGSDSLVRFMGTSKLAVTAGAWYQVVVVGSGPGHPLRFYVTPVTASTVASQVSNTSVSGANGNYATDASHNLSIGAMVNTQSSPFDGQMVDETIYNRALSKAEIQQLFDYTKKF